MKLGFVAFLLTLLVSGSTWAEPAGKKPPPADSKLTLSLDTGRAELAVDAPSVTLRYPLQRLEKNPSAPPVLSLVSVRAAGTLRPDLAPAFEKLEVSPDFASIALTVATEKLQLTGPYELTLQVTPPDLKQLAPSRLVPEFTVPQATLRSVDTLIVERTFGWGWEETTTPLVIEEASRKLPLTGLTFRPGRSTFEGNPTTAGLLLTSKKLSDLGRGRPATLAYSSTGDRPLGSVKGSFELSSPQLGTPLSVPFEIRSRACRGYIFLIIGIGVLLSWFLKYRLKSTVVLAQARLDAARVAERAQQELEGRTDSSFDEALAALEALKTAVKSKDAADIAKAAADLEAKLTAALTTFNQKKADAQKRLDQMQDLAEPHWALPQPLLDVLQDAVGTTMKEAQATLDSGDAGTALQTVNAAEHAVAEQLAAAAALWRKSVLAAGSTLSTYPAGLSKQVQVTFADRFEALRPVLDGAELNNPNAPLSQLLEFLPGLCAVYARANDCFWQLGELMKLESRGIRESFAGVTLKDPAAFEQLGKVVEESSFEVSRQAVAAAGEDALIKLLNDLKAAWQAGLGGQVDLTNVTLAKDKLDAREYVEAAGIVLKVLQKPGGNVPLGTRTLKQASLLVGERIASPTLMVIRSQRHAKTRDPYLVLARQSRWQIARAQFLQTAFAGALATLVGYMTYQKNFVGNAGDVITIFFWAFGIDLSVDALLKLTFSGKAAEG
jgi:hypothetical protein